LLWDVPKEGANTMTIDKRVLDLMIIFLYKIEEYEACAALLEVAKRRFQNISETPEG